MARPALTDSHRGIALSGFRYEANGYKPDIDKLPSEAEYRAAEDKKEDDAKRP